MTPKKITLVDTIVADLARQRSEVYAFSCYLWNRVLVKKILPRLLTAAPHADFVLGGPQIMHHADRYLDSAHERMVICNGEGEKTFSNASPTGRPEAIGWRLPPKDCRCSTRWWVPV